MRREVGVKIKPILFSGPMVLAIEGRQGIVPNSRFPT